MKYLNKILSIVFIVCTFFLNAQTVSIELGIHYPIATKKSKTEFLFIRGNVINQYISANPSLRNNIANALQIDDVVEIRDESKSQFFNFPGINFGAAYTFKKNVRLKLNTSFHSGNKTGTNQFIYLPQASSSQDSVAIDFEQKYYNVGLHTQVAYVFGKKKVHPVLGVGFSWMLRKDKSTNLNLSDIEFTINNGRKQHGVGINANVGVLFNVHRMVDVELGTTYFGIKFLNNKFSSIPSVFGNVSILISKRLKNPDTLNSKSISDNLQNSIYPLDTFLPKISYDFDEPIDFCTHEPVDIRELINKLIELINKLKEEGEKAEEDLEDNDLVNEVKAIREVAELVELLKNLDKVDSEMMDVLTEFMNCNSAPLRKQVESGKDITSTLVLPLKILKSIIGAKMMDKKLSKAERDKLKKTFKYLKEKIEQIENAVEKGENIDKILEYYDKLKTDINWPSDFLKSVLDEIMKELENTLKEKSKDAFKKALQDVLVKLIGNANAAKAVISIGTDILDLVDALDKINKIKDANTRWDKGLLEIIKLANEGKMLSDSVNCVFWNIDKDEIGKVIITAQINCWCPGVNGEGKWSEKPIDLVDSNGKTTKKITVTNPKNSDQVALKVKTPPKSKRECDSDKCIVFINVEIYNKDGKLISSGSMVGGVPAD